MKTGRPPKPTVLKLLAGNPGKRPINAREPNAGDIDTKVPPELSDAAKAHWQRLAPMLAKSGVLKQSDRDLLLCYCESYTTWLDSVRAGKLNVSLLSQLRQMLGEMGMTPAARTRIIIDKPKEKEDGKARFFG
jgi:phage terminase small subunit